MDDTRSVHWSNHPAATPCSPRRPPSPESDHEPQESRFHARRTPRCHRHHRQPRWAPSPCRSGGPGGGSSGAVRQQHAAVGAGSAQLREREEKASGEPHRRLGDAPRNGRQARLSLSGNRRLLGAAAAGFHGREHPRQRLRPQVSLVFLAGDRSGHARQSGCSQDADCWPPLPLVAVRLIAHRHRHIHVCCPLPVSGPGRHRLRHQQLD